MTITGSEVNITSMNNNPKPSKRFRFDSFASEFDAKKVEDHPDDDSGIDSEETHGSPPFIPLSTCYEKPLALVVNTNNAKRDLESSSPSASSCSSRSGMPVRHWKKFLKDQAEDYHEQAENLCIRKDVVEDSRLLSPVTTVAHALLSLAQPSVTPQLNLAAPTQCQKPVFHTLPFPQLPKQPLRPIPLTASPLRPLQASQILNRGCDANTTASNYLRNCNKPENLSVAKLPQYPAALVPTPITKSSTNLHSNQTSSAFVQIQSPTLSSTSQFPSPTLLPLKEIRGNGRVKDEAKQPIVPEVLPQAPILQPLLDNDASISNSMVLSENLPSGDFSSTEQKGKANKQQNHKPFNCLECKKSFSTQSGHAKHQQLHCNNQIQKHFSCKYCNKGYTSLSALKMHIRTHTLPCKCDICGKSFSRPWLLQGHVRTHTGEKPFSCNYCTRSFADKSNLRAHLQTHLQTKKYSCPGCHKTFSRMSLLNKHTDSGCQGLKTRNEECVQTLIGLSSGGLMRS